jgi:hypothetical protein
MLANFENDSKEKEFSKNFTGDVKKKRRGAIIIEPLPDSNPSESEEKGLKSTTT